MAAARAALAVGPVAALTSCAPDSEEAAPAKTQQPVTLRFVPAGWHLEEDKQVVDSFKAENPRVTVEVEPVTGNYNDKITSMLTGGDLPDVIYTSDSRVKPFAAQKVAADMDKLAAKDKQSQELLKDVYPTMLNLGRVKSIPGLYMLPWALDVLVLYYNKSMFQASGVELPKPTWTVNNMIEAAKRLTKASGDPASSQYGINLNWTWWAEYVPWMRGYGGDMVTADGKKSTLDSAGAIEGIEAMASLVTKHQIAPPIGTNFGGDAFQLGKVAMTAGIRNATVGIRKAAGTNFDWDVEIRPAFPKGRVTGMGTAGTTVTTQTKHPEVAWQLAKYTISPPAQKIYAANYAAVPVLQSMRNDPVWRKLPPPPANHDAFVKAADHGTLPPDFPLECGTVYVGDLSKIMTDTITEIISGKSAAGPALRNATALINNCLAAHAP
ncbi:MAG TPA: sugar ABC transporter substrate-binding protein [Chloroflexota bacterium]|nr:sugar ABC transporter substrate-binding protein [Chloroflexota bacterium]